MPDKVKKAVKGLKDNKAAVAAGGAGTAGFITFLAASNPNDEHGGTRTFFNDLGKPVVDGLVVAGKEVGLDVAFEGIASALAPFVAPFAMIGATASAGFITTPLAMAYAYHDYKQNQKAGAAVENALGEVFKSAEYNSVTAAIAGIKDEKARDAVRESVTKVMREGGDATDLAAVLKKKDIFSAVPTSSQKALATGIQSVCQAFTQMQALPAYQGHQKIMKEGISAIREIFKDKPTEFENLRDELKALKEQIANINDGITTPAEVLLFIVNYLPIIGGIMDYVLDRCSNDYSELKTDDLIRSFSKEMASLTKLQLREDVLKNLEDLHAKRDTLDGVNRFYSGLKEALGFEKADRVTEKLDKQNKDAVNRTVNGYVSNDKASAAAAKSMLQQQQQPQQQQMQFMQPMQQQQFMQPMPMQQQPQQQQQQYQQQQYQPQQQQQQYQQQQYQQQQQQQPQQQPQQQQQQQQFVEVAFGETGATADMPEFTPGAGPEGVDEQPQQQQPGAADDLNGYVDLEFKGLAEQFKRAGAAQQGNDDMDSRTAGNGAHIQQQKAAEWPTFA